MADFSFLSDTDESAVEEILSEAADHVTLEQISDINLSAVSDSVLPHHLDARFRRLKTFPSSLSPKTRPPSRAEYDKTPAVNSDDQPPELTESDPDNSVFTSKPRLSPSPSPSSVSSNSWLEAKISPKWKAEGGFGSGRRSGSVFPPMSGCLCCSPRRVSRRKSFGGRRLNDDALKRAVEEEMKIAREAEKIVELALHASARMEASGLHSDDDV